MTVINPTQPTVIASPINLVTLAGSVVLANKLLAGDANNVVELDGNGQVQWGPGGASALDTLLKRNSAGMVQAGNNTNDVQIGDVAGTAIVASAGPSAGDMALQRAGANALILRSGRLDLATTLRNTVAGNEATTANVGTNGAPPAQVVGYLVFQDSAGTSRKIPYYAT